MKVCMFGRSLPVHSVGGMELHIETLAQELVKQGIDVTIITTEHPKKVTCEEKMGVKYHYVAEARPGKYSRAWWKGSCDKFRELQEKNHFDVIHGQSAGTYYLLKRKLNKQYNIPVVVSLHGTSIDEIRTKLRLGFDIRTKLGLLKNIYHYLFWDRTYLRNCDAVIATSNVQVDVIEKYFPVTKNKINLVYNGIDDELFDPQPKKIELLKGLNIEKNDKIVLCVARLKKEKGVQNIISIFSDIIEKHPGTKLLVGGDGEYKDDLIAQAKASGLSNNVFFLGRIDYKDLADYFNACDLFVNSTIRENGYDLTILQAMSCAKPVVVSDIRSVFSVVANGENGYIYPRNELGILKEKVLGLLGDETLRNSIGTNARKTVVEKFSLRSMAAGTISVYNKVLGVRG